MNFCKMFRAFLVLMVVTVVAASDSNQTETGQRVQLQQVTNHTARKDREMPIGYGYLGYSPRAPASNTNSPYYPGYYGGYNYGYQPYGIYPYLYGGLFMG